VSESIIELRNVSKAFGPARAVAEVSLSVPRGGLLALLGHSGCGKTTTLRLIAGLEKPDSGEVWLDGRCVAGGGAWLPPEARRVGLVFQDYALFPHLTLAENIAFGLTQLNGSKSQRVAEMLQLTGLDGLGERYPHQLSGGQQQRVALARALAARPSVVLLDEPFSNLDAALRKAMRQEVRQILQAIGATTLFVTHDQEEALSLADRVAVMDKGRVVQIGTPQEVYLRPATPELAVFLGEANFLPGEAHGRTVTCALGKLLLATPTTGTVSVMIRPEALRLTVDPTGAGCLDEITFFGHDQMARVSVDRLQLQVRTWAQPELAPGLSVNIRVLGPVIAYPT
jgi:iron(III) transport system ATP-binding protein